MYALIARFFDGVDAVTGRIGRTWRSAWRGFRDGPLEDFLFALILFITALRVLVRTAAEELDELLAGVEKAFISVAFLAMTVLSFSDYLQRELPSTRGFLEIRGGPNMAVVLMVWVGFLGASLATKQRSHLAVDASDRLLSPAAARMAKRFSALMAAWFCWHFTGYATEIVDDSVRSGAGQDALPLWDFLLEPVNAVGAILLGDPTGAARVAAACAVVLVGVIVARRRWVDHAPMPYGREAISLLGGVALLVGGLGFLGTQWQPETEAGEPIVWQDLRTTDATLDKSAEEIEALDNELDALIFDSGTPSQGDAEAASVTTLLQETSGGTEFPRWLAQAVIPLSFVLMALRFLAMGLGGRFDPDESLPAPPTHLEPTTGRGARDLIFVGLFPGLILGLAAAQGLSTGWMILLGSVALMLIGAPLFLAIGVAALACVTLIQDVGGYAVAVDMYEAVKKEELLAIPFFVLAGNIMTHGSIAERLVGVARAVMKPVPGGLGLATIFACVIFAAISGSSPVTVIAVGGIMFPMLVKDRYPERYSIGVLTSAGSLGIIIPPSVPMIIYAIMVSNQDMRVSPNDLFIAGVLPGMFIAGVLVLYTLYSTRPSAAPQLAVEPIESAGAYFGGIARELKRSLASLLLPVLILGGIYGILGPLRFTVTEAAAVAVVYALFVELVLHRELKLRELPGVLSESGVMMGSLFLIIVLAIAFNMFIAGQYIPQMAAEWLQGQVSSQWQFLILVNLFLLALGCIMDIVSAILIVAPLMAPIACSYGIDPIHFGIIFIVNLEIGYLTPPMGINLFVASTVFKRGIVDVIRAVGPFLLMMLFSLVVISWFPSLSTALLDRDPTQAPECPIQVDEKIPVAPAN